MTGPAGHEDGEFRGRAGSKEIEHPGVQLDGDKVLTEGDDGKGHQCEGAYHHRREKMEDPIGRVGHNVLLGEGFDRVGERLREPPQAEFGRPR